MGLISRQNLKKERKRKLHSLKEHKIKLCSLKERKRTMSSARKKMQCPTLGMIPWGVSFFEPNSQILIKLKTILPHWSVAQAGLNYEKNWRLKILLDCPLIIL